MFQLQSCCTCCGTEIFYLRAYFCDSGLYCSQGCHDAEGEAHSCGRGILDRDKILQTVWNALSRHQVPKAHFLCLALEEQEGRLHPPIVEGRVYKQVAMRGESVLLLPRYLQELGHQRFVQAAKFGQTHVIVKFVWRRSASPPSIFLFKEEFVDR